MNNIKQKKRCCLGKINDQCVKSVNPIETKSRGKILHDVFKAIKGIPSASAQDARAEREEGGKLDRRGCPRQEGGSRKRTQRQRQGDIQDAKRQPQRRRRSVLETDMRLLHLLVPRSSDSKMVEDQGTKSSRRFGSWWFSLGSGSEFTTPEYASLA